MAGDDVELPGELAGASGAAPDFVAELFAQVDAAVEGLAQVRYAALDAAGVRESVRGLYARVARMQAQALRALAALDDRDDVVEATRAGRAGAVFARDGLGMSGAAAKREVGTARLLDAERGDLKTVGSALAAGTIGRDKVAVCVAAHGALGARVREGIDTWDGRTARRIELVDPILSTQAAQLSVGTLAQWAGALVEELNPKTPAGAHERRFLHMSQHGDGAWAGRFECGPAQGALIKAVIAARSAPQPGAGIDADGVRRQLRDDRDHGQRQMDAMADAFAAAATRAGIPLPEGAAARPDAEPWAEPTRDSAPEPSTTDSQPACIQPACSEPAEKVPAESEPADDNEHQPPEREGEDVVLREPGVLYAPYPPVEIVITIGIEHLVAALQARQDPSGRDPVGQDPLWRPGESPQSPGEGVLAAALERAHGHGYATHAPTRPVDAATLRLLTCNAGTALRRVLFAPGGAVLDLGRAIRLATPAQRRALTARDRSCVIPGCAVPAGMCEAHHVVPWAAGGPTDLDNMIMLCPRHHAETDAGTWQIEMLDGVPWVRLPAWLDRTRPLLRNDTHHRGTAQAQP